MSEHDEPVALRKLRVYEPTLQIVVDYCPARTQRVPDALKCLGCPRSRGFIGADGIVTPFLVQVDGSTSMIVRCADEVREEPEEPPWPTGMSCAEACRRLSQGLASHAKKPHSEEPPQPTLALIKDDLNDHFVDARFNLRRAATCAQKDEVEALYAHMNVAQLYMDKARELLDSTLAAQARARQREGKGAYSPPLRPPAYRRIDVEHAERAGGES